MGDRLEKPGAVAFFFIFLFFNIFIYYKLIIIIFIIKNQCIKFFANLKKKSKSKPQHFFLFYLKFPEVLMPIDIPRISDWKFLLVS